MQTRKCRIFWYALPGTDTCAAASLRINASIHFPVDQFTGGHLIAVLIDIDGLAAAETDFQLCALEQIQLIPNIHNQAHTFMIGQAGMGLMKVHPGPQVQMDHRFR